MQLIKGDIGVGAAEGDAVALRGEHSVIEIFLSRIESA